MQAQESLTVRVAALLGALLTSMSAGAQSQSPVTLRYMLDHYAESLKKQCPEVTAQIDALSAEGDEARILVSRQTQYMICTCEPQNMAAHRATLTEDQLAERIDGSQFIAFMEQHVTGPCMRTIMLDLYSGATCERLVKLKPGKAKEGFCGCMKAPLAQLSGKDVIAFGLATSAYIPVLAEARRKGAPDPVRMPAMERMLEPFETCGGGDFFAQ